MGGCVGSPSVQEPLGPEEVRTPTAPRRSSSASSAGRRSFGRRSEPEEGLDGCFPFTVPPGGVPGQTVRVDAPNGRRVDIVLPPRCRPGQSLLIRRTGATQELPVGSRGRLNELVTLVRGIMDATKASIQSLKKRLDDEVEIQRVLWSSVSQQPTPGSVVPEDIQALVLLAAEMGEVQQLVAALEEAQKVGSVSPSLVQAARDLCSTEEATLTWRCLLDSLVAGDPDGSQVWLEQAKAFGLSVPTDLAEVLAEMARDGVAHPGFENAEPGEDNEEEDEPTVTVNGRERRRSGGGKGSGKGQSKAVEKRLRRAVESGDTAQLEEAVALAEAAGLAHLPAARDAAAALRRLRSGQQEAPKEREASPEPEPEKDTRSAKELLEECRRRCLDTTKCTTRDDLRELLRRNPKEPPASAAGEPSSSRERPPFAGFERTSAPSSVRTPAAPSRPLHSRGVDWHLYKYSTVWERRSPPGHCATRRMQALWVLGLPLAFTSAVTPAELRAAYRKAAMETHPDKIQNHGRAEEAKDQFQKVKEAFDFLRATVG